MGTSNPATVSNVFVYGSLLSDDVVCALLSRVPPSSPATLPDYHRFSIKGRVYPAIIHVENEKVIGKVLIGITPPELYILDTFEDVEYERKTVDVLFNKKEENRLVPWWRSLSLLYNKGKMSYAIVMWISMQQLPNAIYST
ncbi:AIG2-like protein D isoform X2 [Primulina tabacum]|uniref:AIG2-like protein D isoform X2 n=1 Tax=Primulina tabacum TaxID=48773 RepID=UPI003F5A517C